jgi:hypothetical protein
MQVKVPQAAIREYRLPALAAHGEFLQSIANAAGAAA